MTEINFSNIRSHGGSKNNGFEELVCQIAHLRRPDNGKTFVRKEGSGGDAGIECYWILDDNSEIGWQVKYFPNGLNPSRWQQIDESFATALEKHPKLRHYVVCLPLDKSDSRKKGRGGQQVVSVEDEWLQHVEKWKTKGKALGREIEISYWGKHDLTSFLTIDDPLYSGRKLYWFNEPFIGSETFRKIANRSKDSLGDRYNPEFHIELPIIKSFDALCLNPSWWELIGEKKLEFINACSGAISFLNTENQGEVALISIEKLDSLNKQIQTIVDEFNKGIKYKDFHNRTTKINTLLEKLSQFYKEIYDNVYDKIKWSESNNRYRSTIHNMSNIIDDLKYFVKKNTILSKTKSALLYGEAGIGKSHLLCNLSLHRIDNNMPTIFLLGAQYCGGNPTNFIKEALDLQSCSDSDVLGAIDAAGESSGGRALIVIDAINEGADSEHWHNQIAGFLSDMSRYQYIAVLFSCRSTYLNFVLPDSADETKLPRIQHLGFIGYEHRAAEKYLSQQGISKPSAPILAHEFANPLFMKICCQALKQNGQNSFPKGLNSISSLFDFYVESIEKIIAKKKKFNPKENIIQSTLIDIASKLFPNNIEGLPKHDARILVNKNDPNPNSSGSLFDLMLDEGIISEDVSYKINQRGNLIIRFTYERFSDYFIAQHIISEIDDIDAAFSDGGVIHELLEDNGYYRNSGIFEALSIIIAEKYHRELEDLLPQNMKIGKWQLDQAFQNTILWRSPESFSERTLEILNNLDSHSYGHPALEILLKLSTEPNHPWNAEFLHKNLIGKAISERDHFWSTYIALGDRSEEADQHESIVRTITEWAHSGEIETVEKERIRLCTIVLFWFLTTPNRRVRDRSTKSLVRILTIYPELVQEMLHKFTIVNDTYLTERLYAVAYGVVCNINKSNIIKEIANTTYELIFKEGRPIPHILLRDYARGILEYALHLGLLSSEINTEQFRPPYKSSGELKNPSIMDIEKIAGDKYSSRIKSSLIGFPGDFGNYTMSCVHDWSSTSITSTNIKTGFEIKKLFAEELLTGDVKTEFLDIIQHAKSDKPYASVEELIKAMHAEHDSEEYDNRRKTEEEFDNRVKAQLNDDQQEYYRWLSGLNNEGPATFSRKCAQRWVCKRAYELGWTEELFAGFERMCSYGRGEGIGNGAMERVGKKYQWMALHEFLARLSDNYHWINRGYSDVPDDDFYEGPWQINKRDIDPTIWIRQNGEYKTFYNKKCTWWQPYSFPFPSENDHITKTNFLWDEKLLPDFPELLQRRMPTDNSEWLVMHGFWNENRKYPDNGSNSPWLDGWFRINSIFIHKGEYDSLVKGIKDTMLCDPHIINAPSTQHEGFVGEYPWHPIYRHISGWREASESLGNRIPVKHFIPYAKYEWESGGNDYSIDSSSNFHLPAKELIQDMGLVRQASKSGCWGHDGKLVFIDPSLEEYGPEYALMHKDTLMQWLEENNMEIVWLIGGEKQMFSSVGSKFFGRMKYSGLYRLKDGEIVGNMWFEQESGN